MDDVSLNGARTMNTLKQQRLFGGLAAAATTFAMLAAVHGYAAGIQKSAPRESVELERVVVVATAVRHAAAEPMPHVGEL